MSGASRNSSYKLQGLVTLLHSYRISPYGAAAAPAPGQFRAKLGYGCNRESYASSSITRLGYRGRYLNQGLRSFRATTKEADGQVKCKIDLVKDEDDHKTQPTLPFSANRQGFSKWAKWLLGSVLAFLLPFWKQKWEILRGIEGKVQTVVEEAEVVAEVVENVATVVENVATVAEKVSSEMAEKLPEGNKIKQAVLVVEHLSTVTAQEAQLTQDFIHKVGEVEQDLKQMEKIAEPVIDKIAEPRHQQNVS